ncbi:hypothetical protein [Bradyrhizobium sp. BWA-3-5]|uniref:hypothetical protein n=1 Tax=Bradyrhizobium sp. BWA-3-5 TaxID=3080013 RepID=UPI00293EA7B6|nr:hypothetical protein [Bradyrhizobium sp. BWA-3-5]WOH69304.1 hypothetical protein RX331_17070 [Bradyrhizobium sp. BWA-3-5]
MNRLAVPLTYIKGWGTEVSHDEASDDHQFRSRRCLCRGCDSRHLATLPSKHHPAAPVGTILVSELSRDVNRLATEDYDDQSVVYSAKRN